jgi:predicted Holliday junction resolvase-like endonuclease
MLALVIVLAVVLIAVVALLVIRERQSASYRERYTATPADVEKARSDSVAISKGTTRGQAAEHLAAFFPEMVEQFQPGDWRFLGSPVDFVVFDGLSDGVVKRVVLVEVKSGKRTLNARQGQIRSALASGELPLVWVTLPAPKPAPTLRRAVRARLVEPPAESS